MTILRHRHYQRASELDLGNWLRLQLASALYHRQYPLTVGALQSTWRVLSEDPWFNVWQPSLLLTPAQVHKFLLHGVAYSEKHLRLLTRINTFRLDDDGVRRLLVMHQRWHGKGNYGFEEALDDIYRDPLYPIFQHLSQAFKNLVTGRRPFVIGALSSLPSEPLQLCEVGCGSGILFGDILEHNPSIYGIAVDVSHVMIDHAQAVLLARGLSDRSSLVEGDLRDLPIDGSSMDVVVAMEILEHLASPDSGLVEIVRVLRPGGHVVASVPIRYPQPAHLYLFDSVEDVLAMLRGTGLVLLSKEVRQIAPDVSAVMFLAQKVSS